MDFFSTFSAIKQSGFDFGSSVVDAVSGAVTSVATAARNKEGEIVAKTAGRAVDQLTKDKKSRDDILKKIDKRDKNKYVGNNPCTTCGGESLGNPNPNDGKFMGADCCTPEDAKKGTVNKELSEIEPSEGRKPSCAKEHPGKSFPKVDYQNGMNNTEEQVCETMQQIADSQCVEVIAVYNATYNDPTRIKSADADYSNVKKAGIVAALEGGKQGLLAGAASGVSEGPAGIAAGAASGLLLGSGAGFAAGAGKEAALEKASSSGMVQDVLDCLDNLNGAGTEKAGDTQAERWTESLKNGKPVTVYAHSQGGLITREALVATQNRLSSAKRNELVQKGFDAKDAGAAGEAYANEKMKLVTVNSFGTLERDLPPGPTYNRMTNASDPVPEVIKAAQKNFGRPVEKDPPNSPDVHRFNNNPTAKDPFAAHGMPVYLAELEKTQGGKAACC